MKSVNVSKTWFGREAMDRPTRDRFVALGEDGALRLADSVLIADEVGRATRRNREVVAGPVCIRKDFVLDSAEVRDALLCPHLGCDREGGVLRVEVNGRVIRHTRPEKREYWEDRWTAIPVPADALKAGVNEVVFRAEGEAQWTFLIENSLFPNRSAKSLDGGQTWRYENLGVNEADDGEYLVRLRVGRYAPQGEAASEAVDLLGLAGGIAPRGQVESVRLEAETGGADGTAARLFWRTGPGPEYDPATWTAWRPAGGAIHPPEAARFFQWRALLTTARPQATPEVRSVKVEATLAVEPRHTDARVAASDNPEILRSSYAFSYLSHDEKRGHRLRERWRLDEVVRPARTPFEKFLYLRNWVRHQWEDGWNYGEIDLCPPWDGMTILELASRKLSLGMCTHYATVLSHCAAALGLTARTQIMRAHCINEVWSPDHQKWVAMDAGGDANDETKFTYHFERNGVPLSALEAHQAWEERAFEGVKIAPEPPPAVRERFKVESRLQLFDRFMITLRNDELSAMDPGEMEHGAVSYHYDGYLWWGGTQGPLPWFSKHTAREADLYWTVNRTRVHLQDGAHPGALEVWLETHTPNLSGFQVRMDGGEWEMREARFPWTLREGTNRIEARPVNRFGVEGAISAVTVSNLV